MNVTIRNIGLKAFKSFAISFKTSSQYLIIQLQKNIEV